MNLDLFVKALADESHWPVTRDGEAYTITVPLKEGRSQNVRLEGLETKKLRLVRFTSPVGPASDLSGERPLSALKLNAELALGALAVSGKNLVVTDTVLLDGANAKALVATLLYLAEQGDRYEKLLYGQDRH